MFSRVWIAKWGMQRERRSQFVDPEMTRLRNSLDIRGRIKNKKRSQIIQYLRKKGGLAIEGSWDEIKSTKRSQVPTRFDKESPKKKYFEYVMYKIQIRI